eukprot:CAMPEP_0174826954 /NCGR_PEP_ID=MMETSP1114-20130205/362_1 /TAXON_ID=312471 /ORGANISM="Neobodo designis, Strain CCAP 1951/1" /LENGTH=132 /DNA_ID=CAMNT_0016060533 /DNA_START=32 /DNA_END=430 /DNA_ORIENTATION=+
MAAKPSPLGPPVLHKVMDRSKDPLPPIGSSHPSPDRPSPASASSPGNGTNESTPLSGSLAVARRRNRGTPAKTEETPQSGKPSALLDILDPDVDGSPSHGLPVPGQVSDRSPNNHLAPLAPQPGSAAHTPQK